MAEMEIGRKIKSGVFCCAINCTNARNKPTCKGMPFFGFPRDDERSKQWAQNVGRRDLLNLTAAEIVRRGFRLCRNHFEDSQFNCPVDKKRLVWNAVPTVFPEPSQSLGRKRKLPKQKQLLSSDMAPSARKCLKKCNTDDQRPLENQSYRRKALGDTVKEIFSHDETTSDEELVMPEVKIEVDNAEDWGPQWTPWTQSQYYQSQDNTQENSAGLKQSEPYPHSLYRNSFTSEEEPKIDHSDVFVKSEPTEETDPLQETEPFAHQLPRPILPRVSSASTERVVVVKLEPDDCAEVFSELVKHDHSAYVKCPGSSDTRCHLMDQAVEDEDIYGDSLSSAHPTQQPADTEDVVVDTAYTEHNCETCGENLAGHAGWEGHEMFQARETPLAPSAGGKVYVRNGDLAKQEVILRSGPGHLKCDKCGNILMWKRCLDAQKRTSLECDACNKTFTWALYFKSL